MKRHCELFKLNTKISSTGFLNSSKTRIIPAFEVMKALELIIDARKVRVVVNIIGF